eukprot:317953-Chlamydomonas_euryale.AAC.1
MKEFLNDYGMVWVGEPGGAEGEGHFERRDAPGACISASGGGAATGMSAGASAAGPGSDGRPPRGLPPVSGNQLSAAGKGVIGGGSGGGSPTHAPAPPPGAAPSA